MNGDLEAAVEGGMRRRCLHGEQSVAQPLWVEDPCGGELHSPIGGRAGAGVSGAPSG